MAAEGLPRTRSSSNADSYTSEQIQDLLKAELSKYLQFTAFQESLSQALTSAINDAVEAAIKPLQEKINALESQLTQLKEKCNDNEQYSRRCNIRITGIEESAREDCYNKVINFCDKELGVKIDPKEIDRAHRVGRTENGRHRSMIVKLKSFRVKLQVMMNRRKLKGKRIFVNEDLTRLNQDLYMLARNERRDKGLFTLETESFFFKRRADGNILRIRRRGDVALQFA